MIISLGLLCFVGTSCNKEQKNQEAFDATETRSYDGAMMSSCVDLSDQNYIMTIESKGENKILLNNLYEHGTEVLTDVNGSALTIRKQSLDGFLEIDGNGSISEDVIYLNYNVRTPDGTVICYLNAGKVK